jgi:hexosaminidase
MAGEVFSELYRYKNREIMAGPHIEITHGTTFHREFEFFFDGKFTDPQQDFLGEYLITFEGDTVISSSVYYGTNISNFDRSWTLQISETFDCYEFDRSLIEVSYTSLPIREGAKTWYKTVIPNPYPQKKITSIEFKPKKDLDAYVVTRKISVNAETNVNKL